MPPKAPPKKTTVAAKGPAKSTPAKGAPAAKGGTAAAKGGAAKAPAAKGAAGGAAKAPEKKEEPKPVKKILVPEEVGLKEVANVVYLKGDVGIKLSESKRWLFIIDRTDNVGTFLKYRDTNIIDAKNPVEFDPERIRLALMGSLKFGKPLVLIISDTDQEKIMGLIEEKINGISAGLYNALMDRSVMEPEKCNCMFRDSDEEQYRNPYDYRASDFQFVVLTNLDPASTVMGDFFPVIVNP